MFAERGFHGTAVPLIAKKARVAAGTVYRYFDSKECIVNTLYQRYKQQLATMVLANISPEMPARVQFHHYWKQMAEFVREQGKAYQFLELHHHAPYLDDESRAVEGRIQALARMSFEQFREQQLVKDISPEILMAIVHGSFVGLVKACSGEWLVLDDEAVAQSEQCVWEAIRR